MRSVRARGAASVSVIALTAGLIIGLGLVAMGTAVEVSSRPAFCGSCHVMGPYYESWKHSSHNNVACVECHIAPGMGAEIRKKYEALSMVASYFTGTYGTNPWTEIDDAACLRCHERRLLAGKELFGDVLFDHTGHLSGMRRGKTLRCTSCHSQIVQGSHIAVTTSTCILCHFKGQVSNTGTARCTLCHTVPEKVIRQGTLTFNHADVGRFGMDCTWCHARPEGSDGAVPRERCVTCHNEPSRLEEYGNIDLLHRTHVTEHKVDCLNCHLEIQHVGKPQIEAATATCSTCHLKGHSPQMSLYTGIGGRGVDPMPDRMFLAGVRCEGCHLEIPGHPSDTKRASDVSCMSCHGPSYRSIFNAWKEDVTRRTTGLSRQMAETTRLLMKPVPQALDDARFNLDLVEKGHGVHNVDYARALLSKAHDDMNTARVAKGFKPLGVPWPQVPYETPCLQCHEGIDAQQGTVFGRGFRHAPHVLDGRIQCTACHRPHDEKPEGEVLRYGSEGCESCHHQDRKGDCLACHQSIKHRTFPTERGAFSHAFHVDEMGQSCSDCHEMTSRGTVTLKRGHCADCHG